MGLLSRLGRTYQEAARGNNYFNRQMAENELMQEVQRILGKGAGRIAPDSFQGYAEPHEVILRELGNPGPGQIDVKNPAFQEFLQSLPMTDRIGLLQRLGAGQ